MKNIVKTLLVCAICFHSSNLSAQVNEYLSSENTRISNANQIELEIKNFIADDFDNYVLLFRLVCHYLLFHLCLILFPEKTYWICGKLQSSQLLFCYFLSGECYLINSFPEIFAISAALAFFVNVFSYFFSFYFSKKFY